MKNHRPCPGCPWSCMGPGVWRARKAGVPAPHCWGAAHAPGLSQPLPTLPLGDAFAHLPGEAPAGCQLWGQLLGARAPGEVLQAEAAPPCARNPISRPQGQVTNSSIPRPGPTRKYGHFDLPLVLVTTFSLAIIRTRAGKCSSTHCAPRTPAQVWSQAAPEGPAG